MSFADHMYSSVTGYWRTFRLHQYRVRQASPLPASIESLSAHTRLITATGVMEALRFDSAKSPTVHSRHVLLTMPHRRERTAMVRTGKTGLYY